MSQLEFLKGILPERTRYSLRLIRKATQQAKNVFFESVQDMVGAVAPYVDEGWDVYYVTAGLGAMPKAVADNAVAKRELYVDVDCGPNKPYETKAEGAGALKAFCKTVGLPRPTVVDSGNGLHAHWIFAEPVPVHQWKPVAEALKARCTEHNFSVDAACTADIVRVLRVPETINFKNESEVALLTPVFHYEFAALRGVLGGIFKADPSLFAKAKEHSKAGSTGLSKSLAAGDPNRVSKFETIWLKSVRGVGCEQVRFAIENADTLSEPMWRAALSIAQVCDDRDWAIHALSENHPNYSPEETESKATLTRGPYTCETFQKYEHPELCKGCQHMDKITSPVQLGAQIKAAEKDDSVVTVKEVKYEIPEFPFPYFRGKNGGVYVHIKGDKKDDDGDADGHELVYPHDLYVYKRMRDPEQGDVICLRHHLPHDGVREFIVTQKEVGAPDKLRDRLAEQGVAAFSNAQVQKLQRFIGLSIQDLQARGVAEMLFSRFGWTPDNTFIVGNREYTKEGVRHAPVSRNLEKYVNWFTPKGSLNEWKKVADAYCDEAYDLHAIGLLAGFGSVLMKMSPENGGVVAFYSKQSGTGKTTILRAINSIFGDPKALMKDAGDTQMTKVHRMGMLNGICMALDEMTNTTPQELSGLLYGSTQGRPRDRMKNHENAERTNELSWKAMSVWTSNSAIEDRLGLIKADPQGELARVIEIALKTPVPSDVLESQKVFNNLNDNYGHAGDIFLRYVIPNQGVTQKIWNDTRDTIYGKQVWTQTERYRLNIAICIIAAGIITNNLGLTQYNMSRIAKRLVKLVGNAGEELRAMSIRATDGIASFVNSNVSNMLRIDSTARANKLQNVAYTAPKGKLLIRYEPDTKELFIAQKEFNRWCAENYLNVREIKSSYKEMTGHPLEAIRKRMGAGWDADFGMVWAYHIRNATEVLGFEDFGDGEEGQGG